MESNYCLLNETSQIIEEFTQDDIPRCIECNLILSLESEYINGEPTIHYYCENNHKGNILLKDYMKQSKNYSLSKEQCKECGKSQNEIKGEFIYCTNCLKFLCNSCQLNHSKRNHNCFLISRYDSLCKIHSNLYCFYCLECKRNLCIYCHIEHKNHNLINLSELMISEEFKTKIENNIQHIENKINNLENIKNDMNSLIDKIIKSFQLEIEFIKILISTYKYEEKHKNLNYYVIENINHFFKSIKIDSFDKIYNESNNYILLLKNYLANKRHSNNFSKEYKTLNYHKDEVYFLDILKDGRLASCSQDKSLKIYKKNSFEPQLSINDNSNCIIYFTQIKDGRLILCIPDAPMKIIKLIDNNKYEIDQELKEHIEGARKIIEIKENELISVSFDKTMKIWKLNNQNKYICIKSINIQNLFSCCSILKLNDKEFVTSTSNEKVIKFWNCNDYSFITRINNIKTHWLTNFLCLINEDILCIGGIKNTGFYLIKISLHQVIKNISGITQIFSIYKCLDGQLLCSIVDEKGNNNLVKYKYEQENLIKVCEKQNAHKKEIYTCYELVDGTIVSGGKDKLIKLWT